MHLQSIRIRGFKSFVEPVELKLEPGVAVVVGPNGSGKSNVADAIVWAAGSLTPSELRAEKPDDVLFGGSSTRQAADHCEVELLFDNGDGGFGDEIDFGQIAITRRLVRGGEGQYLVNKAAVRRTDLVELLADVGLGGSMHSIVSQGKVDAVLASRPEDRRHLVEEAAGLGKFKRRRHRAELKLARVATQVERAKDVEEEVRKRLRPLALQATAAERAEKLAVEIAALRARIAQLDLEAVAERRGGRRGAPRRDRDRAAERAGEAGRAARGAAARRGRAVRRGRAAARRRSARSTACRVRASASRSGASRQPAWRRGCAKSWPKRNGPWPAAATRRSARSSRQPLPLRPPHGMPPPRTARPPSARAAPTRSSPPTTGASPPRQSRGSPASVPSDTASRPLLSEATGGQEGANTRLVALASARERLGVRREAIVILGETLTGELERGTRTRPPRRADTAELELRANEAAQAARSAATERDDVAERARSARERLQALERAIAEREGIPPAASALAAAGETLALTALEAEPGAERAVAAALAWRASAVLVLRPGSRARAARAGAPRGARQPHGRRRP